MNYWTADQLAEIAAAPKRKHVLMLIEEVRRLTGIAVVAEQLDRGQLHGRTEEIVRGDLRARLKAERAKVRG